MLGLAGVVQTEGLAPPDVPLPDDRAAVYDLWRRNREPWPPRRWVMEDEIRQFGYKPRFSIIVPVHNTPLEVLTSAISSVREQLYPWWELCLADDGSTAKETIRALRDALTDQRIRATRLDVNGGIAAASNAALELARGDYVALLDHDDLLDPTALYEVARLLNQYPELDIVYTDEHKIDNRGRLHHPALKPAFSPDLLLSCNYINHLSVYRRVLVEQLGGFRAGFDGAQDHDLLLRAVEVTDRIGHVAKPVYAWRMVEGSVARRPSAKPEAYEAGLRAVTDAIQRRGDPARVERGPELGQFRVRYDLAAQPLVSIIIPTRDGVDLLRACVDSIRSLSTYQRYEVIIVDNASSDPETIAYLASHDGPVLSYPHPFHYARMMNLAARHARGDLLLFLNNDITVESPDWLEAMIEHAQRARVGAVGGRLFFPTGAAQHEGIFLGGVGGAGNVDFRGSPNAPQEWHFMKITGDLVRNFAAVTGASLMMRPSVLWEVGGFDERLHVAFNDVDLGLKVHARGYDIVYTPYSRLTHHESATRGSLHPIANDDLFRERWQIQRRFTDPYSNPNYDGREIFYLWSGKDPETRVPTVG
jgi:glycosyltransferase involved in cell wall biosynthesis